MGLSIHEAVKTLRSRYGDSQQAFATRLGLSIGSIANYELSRSPDLLSALKLHQLAFERSYDDLAKVFEQYMIMEFEIYAAHNLRMIFLQELKASMKIDEALDALKTGDRQECESRLREAKEELRVLRDHTRTRPRSDSQ